MEPLDHSPDWQFSLKPGLTILWTYRRALQIGLTVAFIAATAWGAYVFLTQPVLRVAAVPFRLTFEGARSGQYPGGLTFSTADILNPEVLRRVYDTNGITDYMALDRFLSAFYIRTSSPEVEILNAQFNARLADPRLSPVDRARVEAEYLSRLDALVLQYELVFAPTSVENRVPRELANKLLVDTLAEWSRQSVELRGVSKYDFNLLGAAAIPEMELASEMFIKRLDLIRGRMLRLIANVRLISTLPGARVARTAKERFSLPERRVVLEDFVERQLEPLYALARPSGLIQDVDASLGYLGSQRERAHRDAIQSAADRRSMEASIRLYSNARAPIQVGELARPATGESPVSTQLDGDLVDRLIGLGRDTQDASWRQSLTEKLQGYAELQSAHEKESAFYDAAITAIRQPVIRGGVSREEAEATLNNGVALINAVTSDVVEIFTLVSKQNLNPAGYLYAVAGPYAVSTTRPTSLFTIVSGAAVAWVAFVLLMVAGVFLYHSVTAKRRSRA